MPRKNSYTGRYKLDKNELGIVKYWARSYWQWKERYKELELEINKDCAIRYDKENVQTSKQSDTTCENAMKLAILDEKIKKIESAAQTAGGTELAPYILRSVTSGYDLPYEAINRNDMAQGLPPMPCGRDYFYMTRRQFYYVLAKLLMIKL